MNDDLAGKTAIVTGASSGIGRAVSIALGQAGATVVAVARRVDKLRELALEIREGGGSVIEAPADVTDQGAMIRVVNDAQRDTGRIDILVAAAGYGVAAPFAQTLLEEYRPMVEVNVMGFLYSLNAVVPIFKKQKSGHVVAISSGTGRYDHPSVVYAGTKHAVSAIAESLRREVGRDGVRVTSIEPGAVKTEFLSRMRPDVQDVVKSRLGDMEQLEAEDVASAVTYALTRPSRVNLNILTIYPTEQA